MRRLLVIVALLVVAVLVWFELRPAASEPRELEKRAAQLAPSAAPGQRVAPASHPNVPTHVRQLASADERAQIAQQIEHAHQLRAATPPALPPPPKLDPQDLDGFKTTLQAAMREAIPLIQHCYERELQAHPDFDVTVRAHLELVGDPDVGTLIDAPPLEDGDGKPLPAKLDDCLRDALQSLELPPLAEGDHVKVTYPFVFRHQ